MAKLASVWGTQGIESKSTLASILVALHQASTHGWHKAPPPCIVEISQLLLQTLNNESSLPWLRRTKASSRNVGRLISYQVKLSRKRTFVISGLALYCEPALRVLLIVEHFTLNWLHTVRSLNKLQPIGTTVNVLNTLALFKRWWHTHFDSNCVSIWLGTMDDRHTLFQRGTPILVVIY